MFSRIYQILTSNGQMSFADRLVAAAIFGIEHSPSDSLGMIQTILPDLQIAVGDIIIDGETALCQASIKGTHKGEFMGISPTRRQIEWIIHLVYTTAGEKLCEAWTNGSASGAPQQTQLAKNAA